MTRLVEVRWSAPVAVTVDLDDGTVESVTASDEDVSVGTDGTGEVLDPRDIAALVSADGTLDYSISPEDAARAVQISKDADWPGWEFGS